PSAMEKCRHQQHAPVTSPKDRSCPAHPTVYTHTHTHTHARTHSAALCECGNGPVGGVLIESFSQTWASLTPSPRISSPLARAASHNAQLMNLMRDSST